jgi:tetratricopeptide (TPR) repeat protein
VIVLPDELRMTLGAVCAAPLEEKGDLIRQHPQVMETRCLLYLTALAANMRAGGNAELGLVALLNRTLLERCRSHGVAVGLTELRDLIGVDAAGGEGLSSGARQRLDELFLDELIDITRRDNLDDPDEAHYAVARADEALQFSNDPQLEALLHLIAGTAWRYLMPTDNAAEAGARAVGHLQAALATCDAEREPGMFANLQNELGLVLLDLPGGDQRGQLHDAVAAFEAALAVRPRDSMPIEWAASANNLGMAFTRFRTHDWVERTEQAIVYFDAALEVLADSGPSRDAFRAHMNLGTAHARLGDLDETHLDRAIDAYSAALSLPTDEIPARDQAGCLINRAQALRDKGAAVEARRDAEAGLALITPGSWPTIAALAHEIIGSTFAKRWAEAGADALQLARAHYRRASQAVGINEAPGLRCQIDHALGDVYLLMGDFESARASYGIALSAHETLYRGSVEEVGRLQARGTVSGLYDKDAYAHLKCGLFETGLHRLEAGRGRWITERLALDRIELGLLEGESRRAFSELRAEVAALQAQIRADAAGSDPTALRELSRANRRMQDLLARVRDGDPEALPQALTIPDFKTAIPPGGAIVYLLVTDVGGAAFIVPYDVESLREENVLWLDGLTSGVVDEMLRGPNGWFRSYLRSDDALEEAVVAVGAKLWDLAMGRLHDRLLSLGLETGASVVVVPSGGLSVLPLHSAWRTAEGGRSVLADEWAISYTPSGFSLSISSRRARDADGEGLLVVVNPTDDLPGTATEANAVDALVDPVTRLEGPDATQPAVIADMPGKRYVHFACHGRYLWSDPLQSELRLAAGSRLTLADVLATVDLTHARLVTLSACETALIDLRQSPDDYVGFPAGFLQAGAPAVLSTLWPVDDIATALFADHFYHALLVGGQSPAVAVCTATRQLREQPGYDHPYFWAPFIVTGV